MIALHPWSLTSKWTAAKSHYSKYAPQIMQMVQQLQITKPSSLNTAYVYYVPRQVWTFNAIN